MTRFPLSRALSGLKARGREAVGRGRQPDWPARPAGAVVWAHVAGPTDPVALAGLGRSLAEEAALTVVVTGAGTDALQDEEALLVQPGPLSSKASGQGFLAHWKPDVVLVIGGLPAPALLTTLTGACPTTVVTPTITALSTADRATRAALRLAAGVWVHGRAAARAARSAGVAASQLRVVGALSAAPEPPPCIESDRVDFAELLAARPVWLAARPRHDELDAVLDTHRNVLAIAHRALLILQPADDCPEDRALALALASQGFTTCCRALGEEPTDQTEIFIADRLAPEEDGLWFRLAPLCFLGGTLSGSGPVQSFEPAAALGSAITFGPHGSRHAAGLSRLADAGAARAVADAAGLRMAIAELLAPDRAAELAHGAWAEMSEGAEVIAQLSAHVIAQLDARGVI